MAIPEGYTKLAKIGLIYKGDFVEGTTYEKLDSVYYQGSTYVALIDNPQGEPIDDNVNWKYVAKGFPSDIDEVEINFEEAQTRENISTGEKIGVIFGKIKKWFSDLTSVAFSQPISSYDDVMANTVAGYTPDALAVKEGFTEVNNNLSNKTGIEQYNFDVSSDVTYDEYTVQNTGWATIYYQFATTQYSQFGLTINGQNIFASNKNISSGNNADGLTGALPLYLQKGDVVKVAYYSTFRMSIIGLRLRY